MQFRSMSQGARILARTNATRSLLYRCAARGRALVPRQLIAGRGTKAISIAQASALTSSLSNRPDRSQLMEAHGVAPLPLVDDDEQARAPADEQPEKRTAEGREAPPEREPRAPARRTAQVRRPAAPRTRTR